MAKEKSDSVSNDATACERSDLEADLAFLLKRAGHAVPADRMPGILSGYRDLSAMLDLLRQPRTAANEPSNVFSLDTIVRGE